MRDFWFGTVISFAVFGFSGVFAARFLCRSEKKAAGTARRNRLFLWPAVFLCALGGAAIAYFAPPPSWAACLEQTAMLGIVFYCTVTDLSERIIPKAAVWSGAVPIGLAAVMGIVSGESAETEFRNRLMGGLAALAVTGIAALLVRGGIGGGDIRLLVLLGCSFGISGITELMFLTLLPCALVGAVLLLSRRGTRKTTIPLGPFLLFGTWGTVILNGIG